MAEHVDPDLGQQQLGQRARPPPGPPSPGPRPARARRGRRRTRTSACRPGRRGRAGAGSGPWRAGPGPGDISSSHLGHSVLAISMATGEPRVRPWRMPPTRVTSSASKRIRGPRPNPSRRRASSRWMSSAVTGRPAGSPSTITTRARPWDSPAVRKRSIRANLLGGRGVRRARSRVDRVALPSGQDPAWKRLWASGRPRRRRSPPRRRARARTGCASCGPTTSTTIIDQAEEHPEHEAGQEGHVGVEQAQVADGEPDGAGQAHVAEAHAPWDEPPDGEEEPEGHRAGDEPRRPGRARCGRRPTSTPAAGR